MARSSAFTRTRFAKRAARHKACVCCGSMTTTPSPPLLCCRKKTTKRKNKSATRKIVLGHDESDFVARGGSVLFVVRQNRQVPPRCQLRLGDDCSFSDFGGWPAGRTHRARERPGRHGSEQRAPGSAARTLD